MGDLFFVLLVVGGLGAFFFTKWRAGETTCPVAEEVVAEEVVAEEVVAEEVVAEEVVAEEVVAEEVVAEEVVAEEVVAEEVVAEEVVAEEVVAEEVVAEEGGLDALSWRILQKVMENPGLLQTKLYKKFPREKRKNLQAVLLQLDNEKVLRREKNGNSYRLFPV